MDGLFVFFTLPWWTFSTRGYEPQCSRPEVIDTTALPLYKLFLDLKTAEFETVGHYPVDNFGWNKYNKNQSSLIPCTSKSLASPFQSLCEVILLKYKVAKEAQEINFSGTCLQLCQNKMSQSPFKKHTFSLTTFKTHHYSGHALICNIYFQCTFKNTKTRMRFQFIFH